jgi:hypothetical protein
VATSMHRLQISLRHWQVQFLSQRARRDGVSIAEVIRQLVSREAEESRGQRNIDSLWEIAGIAEDREPLVAGWAVSERPELYLEQAERRTQKSRSRSRRKRRTKR